MVPKNNIKEMNNNQGNDTFAKCEYMYKVMKFVYLFYIFLNI